MNATELFHKDGKSTGIFHCGKCRVVHRTEAEANQCCEPYKCKTCGAECRKYWTICEACESNARDAKERARFEAAEKVTEWDGFVYLDGTGWGDGYSSDLDEFFDWITDEARDFTPEYVWTCVPVPFAQLDFDAIIQRIEEDDDAYEDFDAENLHGLDALKKAIEAFNEANKGVVSWQPNYKRALLIPKEKIAEIIKERDDAGRDKN